MRRCVLRGVGRTLVMLIRRETGRQVSRDFQHINSKYLKNCKCCPQSGLILSYQFLEKWSGSHPGDADVEKDKPASQHRFLTRSLFRFHSFFAIIYLVNDETC